jgi:hypothetical protein
VRHWRRSIASPAAALQQPLAAFPSWFLRITCDSCGKDRMLKRLTPPGGATGG